MVERVELAVSSRKFEEEGKWHCRGSHLHSHSSLRRCCLLPHGDGAVQKKHQRAWTSPPPPPLLLLLLLLLLRLLPPNKHSRRLFLVEKIWLISPETGSGQDRESSQIDSHWSILNRLSLYRP